MARKHVCVPPCRNAAPMKSHSDGQDVGYLPEDSADRASSTGFQ
jgi:hypothetical protein